MTRLFAVLLLVPALAAADTSRRSARGAIQTGGRGAVRLASGEVVIAGGAGGGGNLGSTEIYDPGRGEWSEGPELLEARDYHEILGMPDGRVFVLGGYGKEHTTKTEMFDPRTRAWTATGSLHMPRAGIAPLVLRDGRIYAIGGYNHNDNYLTTVEIYEPAKGEWRQLAPLLQARTVASANLLPDGRILVSGGLNSSGTVKNCEIYDPVRNAWTNGADLGQPRYSHVSVSLRDGRVLIAGGAGGESSAEVYDFRKDRWTLLETMPVTHGTGMAAVTLADGRILFTGGSTTSTLAQIYDPAHGWVRVADMNDGRYNHMTALLRDGRVLVVGGDGGAGRLSSAEIFDPANGTWKRTGSLKTARSLQ